MKHQGAGARKGRRVNEYEGLELHRPPERSKAFEVEHDEHDVPAAMQ